MAWLLFLVTIAHWEGFWQAHNTAGWIVLLCGVPLLALPPYGSAAALRAFCCAVWVNAAVALAQWAGWQAVACVDAHPCGLMVNKNFLADAAALAWAASLAAGWPALLAASGAMLVLMKGKTALLAAAAATLWWLHVTGRRRLAFAGLLAALALVNFWILDPPDTLRQRLDIWHGTLAGFAWFGHGVESWATDWPVLPGVSASFDLNHGERTPHSEYVALVHELGVLAVLPLAFAASCWWRVRHEPAGHLLVAAAVLGLAQYPLRNPATFAVVVVCLWAGLRAWRRAGLAGSARARRAGAGAAHRRAGGGAARGGDRAGAADHRGGGDALRDPAGHAGRRRLDRAGPGGLGGDPRRAGASTEFAAAALRAVFRGVTAWRPRRGGRQPGRDAAAGAELAIDRFRRAGVRGVELEPRS